MDNSLIPAPRFKYSLSWAASVIDEVCSKYPRASEMICRVYGISRYDLVKYLAKPDVMWVYLRERIKYLALCEERVGRPMDYLTVVEWCKGLHGMKHAHGQGERLDKRLKELILKEQGSRGGRGRSEAKADPSLPYLPPSSPSPNPEQFTFDFIGGT
jgi:hypothetical protein